jgi:hypothetical protein
MMNWWPFTCGDIRNVKVVATDEEPTTALPAPINVCVHGTEEATTAQGIKCRVIDNGFTAKQKVGPSETQMSEDAWHQSMRRLLHDDSDDNELGNLQSGTPTKVRHIMQQETWDCGVTCLLMVIEWLCNKPADRTLILNELKTVSIWTVDLVLCLHRHEFRYLFCSKEVSFNETLRGFDYYRNAFENDRPRVHQIFQRIRTEHMPTFQVDSMPMSRIIDLVSRNDCIAIALVDNSILLGNADAPYRGHYIVLVGFQPNFFLIQDPGSVESCTKLSLELFERAWRAPGTDEDIIFVVKTDEEEI